MSSQCIWAQVKCLIDGEKIKVPIDFFDDSVRVERELRASSRRSEYKVFYSPYDKDTPDSILREESRVLEVDNLSPRDYNNLRKKHKYGIPGWYKAVLTQWEENLAELESVIESAQPGNGKVRTRTSNKAKPVPNEESSKISGSKAAPKKNVISKELGRNYNLHSNEQENSADTSSISKRKRNSDDADNLSPAVSDKTIRLEEQLKKVERERDAYAKEVLSLKDALDKSKEEQKQLMEINLFWQKKEMDRKSSSSSSSRHKSKSSSSQRTDVKKTGPQENSELFNQEDETVGLAGRVPKSAGLNETEADKENQKTSDENSTPDDITHDIVNGDELKGTEETLQGMRENVTAVTPNSLKTKPVMHKSKEKAACGGVVGASEVDFNEFCVPPPGAEMITFEQFQANCRSVKVGKDGDSQFFKNCMALIWSDEVLIERSATGSTCPINKDKQALKGLTPTKKNYAADVLKYRIKLEVNTVSPEELELRTSSKVLNRVANAKIATVARGIAARKLKEAELNTP